MSQASVYAQAGAGSNPPGGAITGKIGSGKGFYTLMNEAYVLHSYQPAPLATLDYEATAEATTGEKFSLQILINLSRIESVVKAFCCSAAMDLDYSIALCRAHPTFPLDHAALSIASVPSATSREALTAYLERCILAKQFSLEAVLLAEEMKTDAFARLLKARQQIRREEAEAAAASRGDRPISQQRRRR